MESVADVMRSVLAGKATEIELLRGKSRSELISAYAEIGKPVVSRVAVLRVLADYESQAIEPQTAQAWGEFVRWGGFWSGGNPASLEPIDGPEIRWESDGIDGNPIIEVLARLEEMGDYPDNEIQPSQLAKLRGMLQARSE